MRAYLLMGHFVCMAGSKEQLLEAIVGREVRQYQVSEYEKGQRATDYTTWLTSQTHYTAKFEEVCSRTPCALLLLLCHCIWCCVACLDLT